LVKDPILVLADEPTANLDSHTGDSVLNLMKRLNEEEDVTFIFSSHDNLIIERAKRVIRLRDGQLVGDNHDN
jgi:putative ABC transport system ATP-binding protein